MPEVYTNFMVGGKEENVALTKFVHVVFNHQLFHFAVNTKCVIWKLYAIIYVILQV